MADDLISRQVAIDAMENVDWYHINSNGQLVHGANSKEDEPLYKAEDVYKVLNDVPSAQPEIVRCKDCKHHDGIRCFRWNSTIITKFDDFCSNAERRTDERSD